MAVLLCQAYHALAILELGAGRYEAALDAAEQITNTNAIGWSCQTLAFVVEAAVRCGKREPAERALAELTIRAEASGKPWGLGLLARSRGLMTDGDAAGDHFEEAIGHLQQTMVRTDLMITHLVYGEWLRRQKRRLDARVHLRTAHEEFAAMGAEGFAQRARTELLATGERRGAVPPRQPTTSLPKRFASLAWRHREPLIRRSRLSCSSAQTQSTTTCARSTGSLASSRAGSWAAFSRLSRSTNRQSTTRSAGFDWVRSG